MSGKVKINGKSLKDSKAGNNKKVHLITKESTGKYLTESQKNLRFYHMNDLKDSEKAYKTLTTIKENYLEDICLRCYSQEESSTEMFMKRCEIAFRVIEA